MRPGPTVAAIASISFSSRPASRSAFSVSASIARRCSRAATSGTMPPVSWCASCEATRSARIRRPSSTTATPVSSHDVSIARTRTLLIQRGAQLRQAVAHRTLLEPLGPHDERVLVVVGVVPAPHAGAPETVLLVQLLRGQVRGAHLQRQPLRVQRLRDLEEA